MKLLLLLLILALMLPTLALAGDAAIGDGREGGEPLIDLLWWMRGACWKTPFWETSGFWGDVWGVVNGAGGEWWR